MIHSLTLRTNQHGMTLNITHQVEACLQQSKVTSGLAVVYCLHTTAGIIINENADPDVKHDLLMRLDELVPWKHSRDKHREGNTAAHVKAVLVGNSQMIPIENGRLVLGQWQGIYFCEFDGPRERKIIVKIISD